MKTLIFFKVSISIILIYGCKNDSEDIEVNCGRVAEAPSGFKDYFIFKKESWWLYNLVGTNDTDKRTVTSSERKSYQIKSSENYGLLPCIYRYTCLTDHTHPFFKNVWQGMGDAFDLTPQGDSLHWIITHSSESNIYPMETFVSWPLVNNSVYGNSYMIDSLDAKVEINGNEIDCIKIKKMTISPADSNFIASAYFSRGIGLVKYTIVPKRTWILKQYVIKQ